MGKKEFTIYERVILVQLVAIVLIMAVNGCITYRINWTREIRRMNMEIEQVSRRLSSQISIPFWILNENETQKILLQEIKNPYLSGIAIMQDRVLWTGITINQEGTVQKLSGMEKNVPATFYGTKMPPIKVFHTDNRGKAWELGDLVLYTTDTPVKKIVASLLWQAVIQTIALIIGLNILTIVLLYMFLNKPLEQITNTARRIGDGEIDLQVEVAGTREIKTLATAFNKMTSRLRESIAELDRYFTNSLDLLCIADTKGVFRKLNMEWESTLGYSIADLVGRSFLDFVHTEDLDRTLAELQNLNKNESIHNFVNRFREKDGTYRWLEWRSFPYGNVIYAVARDITARVRDENEMRRMNEELEQKVARRTESLSMINRELESFSYSVSHDLRSPLRHIIGFINLLESECKPVLSDKGKHYLDVITSSSKKMGLLIDQLLELSRTGRQEVKKTRVDMNALVREVLNELSDVTSKRTISWVIDDLPETSADPLMLQAVLTNLIGNALKFTRTKENARIHICSLPGDGKNQTVYFVRDNGVGFDMKYQNKLFGVFQRLHSSDNFEGTGIGLANVHRIISRHGGRVWAEGEIDNGATFYFSLLNDSKTDTDFTSKG